MGRKRAVSKVAASQEAAPGVNESLEALRTPLAALKLDPANARKHSRRNLDAIKASLRLFGQQKPIVVLPDGTIIAGNGTVLAARELGWEHIAAVQFDGEPAAAKAFALADNRTAELAEWDREVLAESLAEVNATFDLDALGWTPEEHDELLGIPAGPAGSEDEEDLPADVPTRTQPGDLWLLGEHRLLCGDATSVHDVGRLMRSDLAKLVYTDPPYGVDYDGGHRPGQKKQAELRGDGAPTLYSAALLAAHAASDPRAPLYLWYADREAVAVFSALDAAGYKVRAGLVWRKLERRSGAISAQYKSEHEPLIYAHRKGESPYWYGSTAEWSVWEASRARSNDLHPTQKPIELAERVLRNSSKAGDVVLDLFAGSGATLIAAERMKRRCYAMEIDAHYSDVIVRRWEEASGQVAKKEEP